MFCREIIELRVQYQPSPEAAISHFNPKQLLMIPSLRRPSASTVILVSGAPADAIFTFLFLTVAVAAATVTVTAGTAAIGPAGPGGPQL